jgi:hypothetical protein
VYGRRLAASIIACVLALACRLDRNVLRELPRQGAQTRLDRMD